MSGLSIMESCVNDVISTLKSELPAALAGVRTERGDAAVTTELPVNYFIYEKAIGYKTPSVFVIADRVDFRLDKGQNHINSLNRVTVSCVVEDRNAENLQLKMFRYHDAIYKSLNRAQIVSNGVLIKNTVKVIGSEFSIMQEKKTSHETIFRKEVMLTLEVEHYEAE